ncbi:unnamed protein product [Amoebophrya sp. A120]|nr:unnamed protein product [Amoebophrya sp. A120]|eukprot:GSA120T00009660001.1
MHLNTDYFLHDPVQELESAASKPSEMRKTTPEGYIEILPNRLYWTAVNSTPRPTSQYHFFCIDQDLVYEPFNQDFGPLNLSCTYKFARLVKKLLDDPSLSKKKLVHYCSLSEKKRPNAAYLMCCFQVMYLNKPAELAYRPFENIRPQFQPFRDATAGMCNYACTVLDCVKGLEYAMKINWFNPETFNVQAYDYYEKVDNGDISWVIPEKFLAFSGPSGNGIDTYGYPAFTPEDYVPIFRNANVSTVVRLNKEQYDAARFTMNGIKHVDMFFPDGSCPPRDIVNRFLRLAESEPAALAVHCKAGLGRTGTLIGLYAQKHYKFPGRAYIGWNRIARPGAILGPQQQYLCDMEREMIALGEQERATKGLNGRNLPSVSGSGASNSLNAGAALRSLTAAEKKEDVGQGERLVAAKAKQGAGAGALTAKSSISANLQAKLTSNVSVGGTGSYINRLTGSEISFSRFSPGLSSSSSPMKLLGQKRSDSRPIMKGMFGPQGQRPVRLSSNN